MFNAFISLGQSCKTASSMSKYGLRAFSGPFDWLISDDFQWVLRFIETDFSDFIRCDQLESYMGHPKRFKDKASGFIFLHEREDYRNQYELLKEKYNRRIQRFLRASCEGACFLRYVNRQDELDYIKNNAEYVRHVIGRHNQQNEIVLLVERGIQIPENMPFRTFQAVIEPNSRRYALRASLRAGFDGMIEFLEYCGRNYPGDKLIKNLMFDGKAEEQESQRINGRYRTALAMSCYDFSQVALPPEIMIYGAGKLGQTLYEKIRQYTKVKCFVDRSKGDTKFKDIPIYSITALDPEINAFMIVSTTYDFESIRENIQKRCKEIKVVSLDKLMEMEG